MNREAIYKALIVFQHYRSGSFGVLERILHRLATRLGLNRDLEVHLDRQIVKSQRPRSARRKSVLSQVKDVYRHILFQKRHSTLSESKITVLALSGSRFNLGESNQSIREVIHKTLFPRRESEVFNTRLEKDLLGSDRLYLFDPSIYSALHKDSKKLEEQNIVIIDGLYIFLSALLNIGILLKAAGDTVFTMKNHAMRYRSLGLKNVLASAVISRVYARILMNKALPCRKFNAYFLTSNSYLTELFRYFLLTDDACVSLTEIMHGVQSNDDDRYFSQLGEVISLAKQHYVFMLPGLPDFGMYNSTNCEVFTIDTNANVKIANYVKKHNNDLNGVAAEFRAELGDPDRDTLLLGFIGGNSHYKNFFESLSFAVEKKLLTLIVQHLSSRGIKHKLIYCLHPVVALTDEAAKIFDDLSIRVNYNIIPVVTSCEAILSSYSGGLFQASFIGAKTFTPLTPADGVFPPSHFGKLIFPSEDESIEHALQRFLDGIDPASEELDVRIHSRLGEWVNLEKLIGVPKELSNFRV